MDLTKWFDTNYHYLVPEFDADQTFRLASDKPFAELAEARALGVPAKPVLLGPITFLYCGRHHDEGAPLALLDALLPVYAEVVRRLAAEAAAWIPVGRTGPRARPDAGGTGRGRTGVRGAGGRQRRG